MALLTSLIAVTLVMGIGVSYLRINMATAARMTADIDRWRAFYMAEAALAEGTLAVAQGRSGNIGSQELPASFGEGLCWVNAEVLTNGRVQLKATGLVGRGRASLGLLLERSINPLGELGFFGEAGVILEPDVIVSGQGGPGAGALPARIGSNADIEVRSTRGQTSEILGVAMPGPDGVVVLDPGALVTGSVVPRAARTRLPELPLPSIVQAAPLSTRDAGRALILGGGDHGYESLSVTSGTELRLVGPVRLLVGSLSLASNSVLTVDSAAGPVSVFVEHNVDFASGSNLVDVQGDASSVLWVVAGAEDPHGGVTSFEASGTLAGIFYAPNADLRLPAGLQLNGSLVSRSLVLASGVRATFDVRVMYSGLGTQALPEHVGWRVVEFAEGTVFGDAGMHYRLRGVVPLPLDEAQREQEMQIEYLDAAGVLRSYTGLLEDLDPADVRASVDLAWIDPDSGLPLDQPGQQGLPNLPSLTSTETAAVRREHAIEVLASEEMLERLLRNSPLSQARLLSTLAFDPPLLDTDLLQVMVANSPLPSPVLDELMRAGSLTGPQMAELQRAQ